MGGKSTEGLGIVDFHCDALWKLLEHESLSFGSGHAEGLDVNAARLEAADSLLQTFAIYVPDKLQGPKAIWRSVDLFYQQVLSCPKMQLIRNANDLQTAHANGHTGALLSLEGVDGLEGDLVMLRLLYQLGLRAVGLTWNYANWAADGVLEPRQGGLTAKGRAFVEECEKLGIILDVSHLTERGFWELADLVNRPFIASHSNAKAICNHPRNLTDDQIKAILAMDGRIGITYVPYFVKAGGGANVADVVRHIDHIVSLGGEDHIMMGSDFDGISEYVEGLTNPADVINLINELRRTYSEQQVQKFMSGNALAFLKQQLPK
ncbi:Membrane dipeptidase [Paenibacillus curdlanolyticus YK9]|uniref:Membrane dipeptidase n=1 Tax=Paenibacillus curdlanolyticus YK9 TaxID=717606 RepID=E0I4C5_9BACL|nr:dipeptidase [Paenibacillus curdlanolyticus]EFM13139.1 Membrane dipeptidase [Paenibacillus curdlanolyticus YK9]